jgi:hypothetical protein
MEFVILVMVSNSINWISESLHEKESSYVELIVSLMPAIDNDAIDHLKQ